MSIYTAISNRLHSTLHTSSKVIASPVPYRYELTHISKQYGTRQVLHIDRLTIAEGKTLALLGPSGAGKSTLLRLLNFLEEPDGGKLTYAGQPIVGSPSLAIRRTVTTVFQKPLLLNSTVLNNVAYGLWLRGRRESQKVEAVLERVGMLHLARARATSLSGGEAQRVALARALVIEPEVLLLDEPTANLDPANVALIEQIITDLSKEKATIVIVTHNIFQARRLADDVALLINGQLVEFGSSKQLFEAPKEEQTKAFMAGTMIW